MTTERQVRYFEVFGDSVAELIFLRNLTIVLVGLLLVLTVSTVRLANKPPIVIRVDSLGEPLAFAGYRNGHSITGPEVRNFAEHFTRYLRAWDKYSLDEDLDRAFGMMTPEAGAKMKRHLDSLGVSQLVAADSLRSKVGIQEIAIEQDSPSVVRLKVRGSRVSESYEKPELHKETIFEDSIVARKVERTETSPWGLLIEDWSEKVFKETP